MINSMLRDITEKPEIEPVDWRAECAWLVELAEDPRGLPTDLEWDRLAALRVALAQPERSRPEALPSRELARQTIAAMKAGAAIDANGIKAVVECAEVGIRGDMSFKARWAADMGAIKRWRAGQRSADVVALVEAARAALKTHRELRALEESGTDHNLDDQLDEELERVDDATEAVERYSIEAAERANRELILPDHADLVVWLLKALERPAEVPPIAEVQTVLDRLEAVTPTSGLSLQHDAAEVLRRLVEALRASERLRFMAERDAAELRRRPPAPSISLVESIR